MVVLIMTKTIPRLNTLIIMMMMMILDEVILSIDVSRVENAYTVDGAISQDMVNDLATRARF